MADTDNVLLRRRLLGRNLRSETSPTQGIDLMLTRQPDGLLALDLVEGVENLAQALAVAVLTPLGEDLFDQGFGFDGLNALIDETNPRLQRERVRASMVRLLHRDPRVGRVVDVKLYDGRLDKSTTGMVRELDVRVVFETIASDRLMLATGSGSTEVDHV